MSRRRDIVWEWVGEPGVEHLSLRLGGPSIVADGLVVGRIGQDWLRLRYRVECDPEWAFRSASIAVDGAVPPRAIEIARGPDGWTVAGIARPDLAAAGYIDIMCTPFTNALPIRHRRWRRDAPQRLAMSYVRVPDLTVTAVQQEYTLIAPRPARRFRYRGLDTGFQAEIAVDRDGIVLDYGAIWRRRTG
ncbi:MAG: putative glycolipid-binding domain-containing protein [Alphaproteobacteria bacterium]